MSNLRGPRMFLVSLYFTGTRLRPELFRLLARAAGGRGMRRARGRGKGEAKMLLRRQVVKAATAFMGAVVFPACVYAQGDPATDNLGLKGYDPVAYFTLSAPTHSV